MKSALVILICVAVANASSSSGSSGGSSGSSAVNYGSPSSYSVSASASVSSASSSGISASASVSSASSSSGISISASISSASISVSASISASPSNYVSYSVSSSVYSYSADLPSISLSSTALLSDLIPSSYVESTVSSSLLQTLSCELMNVEATIPSISDYAEYLEMLFATDPSVECAEDTLEQDIRSHAHTVTEIEDALSSPSTISQPTYIASLEDRYPSVVSAYQTIFDAETSHPYFAYEQTLLTSLMRTHQTLLSDLSIIQQASSPVTDEAETVVYYAVESSPSLKSYMHSLAEVAEHYSSVQSAENLIEYYEKCEPSIVQTISEAILSPSSVGHILVASYPTLASADEEYQSCEKSSASVAEFISHAVDSYSQLRDSSRSYARKLFKEHSSVYSACEEREHYKKVHSSIFNEVSSEESNPARFHAAAAIANPQLAYAFNVVDKYQNVISSSEFDEIDEEISDPQELNAAAAARIHAFAQNHVSLSSAFSVINKYNKVNQKVVQQVHQQMSCSGEHKARQSLQSHSVLANAFKVVNAEAQVFPAIHSAQAGVDCAESSHDAVFNAYEHVSQAKASAKAFFKHSAVVQKSCHQSAHQSFHQSAHQSAHQNAHQSFHQSFHHGTR